MTLMKKITILIILACTQLSISQNTYDIVFKNVNIVSVATNKVILNQTIGITNNQIKVIEDAKKSKARGIKEFNLNGKYIMPSLADAHVHLPENIDDMKRFLELNLINGVTKLRSMRGDWKHKEWREKFNEKNSIYPKLYLSPPPITRGYDLTPEQIENFVKATKDYGFDFIKILSIKSQDIFILLDEACKKHNITLGGHFPKLASGNAINENIFFNSNYKSIEHLGGLVNEPELFDSRIENIKKNDIYICPTLLWYSIGSGQYDYDTLLQLNGMEHVSNQTMTDWIAKTKEYRNKLGEQAYKEEVSKELKELEEKYQIVTKLQKEGVKMLLSPDASSKYMMTGFNIIDEMELLKNAKLSNAEILQMATINFAAFFNEEYGKIEVNKPADFILLDENPLENLRTLKKIKGIYFNNNYLNENDIARIKEQISKL